MARQDNFISGIGNVNTNKRKGTIIRNPRNIGGNGNNLYFEPYCLPSSTNPGYFYPIGDENGTLDCNPNAPKPNNPIMYGSMGSCPPGQHMMPDGSCMDDSDMYGGSDGGGNNNSIIQTNLTALRNDFVYKSSGQPYIGPFHVHANGTLMIGAGRLGINHAIKPNEVIVPKGR